MHFVIILYVLLNTCIFIKVLIFNLIFIYKNKTLVNDDLFHLFCKKRSDL